MVSDTVQQCVHNQTSFFRLQFWSIHKAFSKKYPPTGEPVQQPESVSWQIGVSDNKTSIYYKELEKQTCPVLPRAVHTEIQLPVTHLSTEPALSLQQNKTEKNLCLTRI